MKQKITVELIKALKERVNFGLFDCKKALEKYRGDIDKAEKYLKNKGILFLNNDL